MRLDRLESRGLGSEQFLQAPHECDLRGELVGVGCHAPIVVNQPSQRKEPLVKPLAAPTPGGASRCNSDALACLNETMDTSGQPRKVIADEWFQRDEHTLSKMAGGALAFGIDRLDQMPVEARVDWLSRYARRQGFRLDPIDTDQEMRDLLRDCLERIESLAALHSLRDVRTKPAKADLPLHQERRRA